MEGEPNTNAQIMPEDNQERQATEQENVASAEQTPELQPRIYVASLADYNAGILHGAWLEAAQETEQLDDAIQGMLQASPSGHAEEWAIHDFEGFNGLHLGEWEDLGYVSRIAKGIQEHGLAFAHWTTLVSTDEDLSRFEESYLGHWTSVEEYARDVLEDLGLYEQVEAQVPENLRPYVTLDASGFGRDLVLGGDIWAAEGEGGVYVFSNR